MKMTKFWLAYSMTGLLMAGSALAAPKAPAPAAAAPAPVAPKAAPAPVVFHEFKGTVNGSLRAMFPNAEIVKFEILYDVINAPEKNPTYSADALVRARKTTLPVYVENAINFCKDKSRYSAIDNLQTRYDYNVNAGLLITVEANMVCFNLPEKRVEPKPAAKPVAKVAKKPAKTPQKKKP